MFFTLEAYAYDQVKLYMIWYDQVKPPFKCEHFHIEATIWTHFYIEN